jgi:K+-transporting ATPase A subunit
MSRRRNLRIVMAIIVCAALGIAVATSLIRSVKRAPSRMGNEPMTMPAK